MLRVLIARSLEQSSKTAQFGKGVAGLSVSEPELQTRDPREAPRGSIVVRELGRKQQLENFRLILEPLVSLAVIKKACDARNINSLGSLELADPL